MVGLVGGWRLYRRIGGVGGDDCTGLVRERGLGCYRVDGVPFFGNELVEVGHIKATAGFEWLDNFLGARVGIARRGWWRWGGRCSFCWWNRAGWGCRHGSSGWCLAWHCSPKRALH